MNREEQILKAARDYNSGITLSSPSSVIHFENGAKWADEHPVDVWHQADKEPQGNNWKILCQDEDGGCWVENKNDAMRLHNTWNEYAAIEMVVKWAYINELIED